jgi:hypothetical protein
MCQTHRRTVGLTCGTLLAASFVLLLIGCASTAPRPTSVQPIATQYQLHRDDVVNVKVTAAESIAVDESVIRRVAQNVKQKIAARRSTATQSPGVREYEVEVRITRYDEGNAFARAMLAGLGQMHIDAHISVLLLPDRIRVAEFDVEKTFAWGGLYGAATSIKDVEEGFAGGVAEGIAAAP